MQLMKDNKTFKIHMRHSQDKASEFLKVHDIHHWAKGQLLLSPTLLHLKDPSVNSCTVRPPKFAWLRVRSLPPAASTTQGTDSAGRESLSPLLSIAGPHRHGSRCGESAGIKWASVLPCHLLLTASVGSDVLQTAGARHWADVSIEYM